MRVLERFARFKNLGLKKMVKGKTFNLQLEKKERFGFAEQDVEEDDEWKPLDRQLMQLAEKKNEGLPIQTLNKTTNRTFGSSIDLRTLKNWGLKKMMEGLEFSTGNVHNMCFCIGSSLQQYLCIQDNQFLQYPSGKSLILTVKASEAEAKTLKPGKEEEENEEYEVEYVQLYGLSRCLESSSEQVGIMSQNGTLPTFHSKFDDKVEASSAEMYFDCYEQLLHEQNMLQGLCWLSFYMGCAWKYTAKIDVDPETLLGYLPPPPPSLSLIRLVINMFMQQNHLKWAGYICKLNAGNPSLDQIVTVIKGRIEEVELPEKADILIYEPQEKKRKDAGSPIETLKKMMNGTLGSSIEEECGSSIETLKEDDEPLDLELKRRMLADRDVEQDMNGTLGSSVCMNVHNMCFPIGSSLQQYLCIQDNHTGVKFCKGRDDGTYIDAIGAGGSADKSGMFTVGDKVLATGEEEAKDAVLPIETLKKIMNGTLESSIGILIGRKEEYGFAYRDVEQDVPLDLQLVPLDLQLLNKRKMQVLERFVRFKNWGLKKMMKGTPSIFNWVLVADLRTLKNWGLKKMMEGLEFSTSQFLQYPSGKTLILTVKASEAEAKTLKLGKEEEENEEYEVEYVQLYGVKF
ncbi:protein arginine methyltransferase 4B [Actinidia rufa]|uniref:Protein arginine methyltransferase 4B n=1 Tax=Actinidia rufa TaxID=165716 RepID=A0A7J0GDI5_9ERIC|nr:protein arginine methyltransferase 4B [Actinidia rufa]